MTRRALAALAMGAGLLAGYVGARLAEKFGLIEPLRFPAEAREMGRSEYTHASESNRLSGARAAASGRSARGRPYVASRRSGVIHRPGCPDAQRISERRLLGYDSLADALADGGEPCRRCRPQP